MPEFFNEHGGAGLGTSSSFAVGLLNAFYALKGKYADKKQLADEAIYIERELCKENGGTQILYYAPEFYSVENRREK